MPSKYCSFHGPPENFYYMLRQFSILGLLQPQIMRLILVAVALMLCCLIVTSNGSKILFLIPFASKSQRNTYDPLIEEMAKRNHEITLVTNIPTSKIMPGVKIIFLENCYKFFMSISNSSQAFNMSLSRGNSIFTIFQAFSHTINVVYNDTLVQEFIKNMDHYDVIIMNIMSEPFMHIAHKIDAPIIILSPPALLPHVAWDLNIPSPFSYVPVMMSPFKPEMTFLQRLANTLMTIGWLVFRNIFMARNDALVSEYLPIEASSVDLAKNVSLVLVNTHFSFDQPRPSMPYLVEIGGMHCRPGEDLPKELETFIQGSGEHGFIVFSMGSILQGQFLPDHVVAAFKWAFSKLKQNVIWKYETNLEGLSKNVMISKWIPQQDLMAHPKCRLAITHGGIASLQEVAYHGVPLLGVPLGMDRDANINLAIDKGFAEMIDWQTVTPESLLEAINQLLTDKKYKENAAKVSALIKDRPQPPLQTAVYWVEYVIRHKGAKHLKSAAEHLNFFQYFLLDVIAFLLLAFTLGITVFVFIVKRLLRLCSSKKPKNEVKKVKKN